MELEACCGPKTWQTGRIYQSKNPKKKHEKIENAAATPNSQFYTTRTVELSSRAKRKVAPLPAIWRNEEADVGSTKKERKTIQSWKKNATQMVT